jgi:hypothetical protein
MKQVFTVVVLLVLLLSFVARAQKPSWEYPTVKMPAWHGQALAMALQEFRKNQGGHTDKGEPVYGDLRHYSVSVISREDEVEIAFIPESGLKDIRNATVGGRGQYGIEVYYHISKSLRLLRTTFAR